MPSTGQSLAHNTHGWTCIFVYKHIYTFIHILHTLFVRHDTHSTIYFDLNFESRFVFNVFSSHCTFSNVCYCCTSSKRVWIVFSLLLDFVFFCINIILCICVCALYLYLYLYSSFTSALHMGGRKVRIIQIWPPPSFWVAAPGGHRGRSLIANLYLYLYFIIIDIFFLYLYLYYLIFLPWFLQHFEHHRHN